MYLSIYLLPQIGNCSVNDTRDQKGVRFNVPGLTVPWLHQLKKAYFKDEAFNGAFPEVIKHQATLVSSQNQF